MIFNRPSRKQLIEQLHKSVNENNTLTVNNTILGSDKEKLVKYVNELEAKNHQLTEENEGLQRILNFKEDCLEIKKRDQTKLIDQVADLQNQKRDLKMQFDEHIELAECEVERLLEKINSLNVERDDLKRALLNLEDDKQAFELRGEILSKIAEEKTTFIEEIKALNDSEIRLLSSVKDDLQFLTDVVDKIFKNRNVIHWKIYEKDISAHEAGEEDI